MRLLRYKWVRITFKKVLIKKHTVYENNAEYDFYFK